MPTPSTSAQASTCTFVLRNVGVGSSFSFRRHARNCAEGTGEREETLCCVDGYDLTTKTKGCCRNDTLTVPLSLKSHLILNSNAQSYGAPSKKPVPGQALHIDDACYCLVSIGVRNEELFARKGGHGVFRLADELCEQAQANFFSSM